MMIIDRKETDELKKIKKWILVYGRRKTGKTFMVRNFIKYDNYFFVKRDRSILTKNKSVSYDAFIELFGELLKNNKRVVVDEFHRFGDEFLDYLHYVEKKGQVILISSTLHTSKKLLDTHSPILGIFAEFPLRILSLEDVLNSIGKKEKGKELVELGILLREPLIVGYYAKNKKPRKIFTEVIKTSKYLVPALVGEIFTEEERTLSAIYGGVLRAIAGGEEISSGISSYLFSRKLIKKDDPSMIQQYLNNLTEFGLIRRIKIYNKKYYVYKHVSPLTYLYYYADEKYNLSEITVNDAVVERIINELMPRIVEDNVRKFLSDKFGLTESIINEKDYDVDACLLRFKKPEVVVEIKWKEKLQKSDIDRVEEILTKTDAKRKMLFVPDRKKVGIKTDLEVVDIRTFL